VERLSQIQKMGGNAGMKLKGQQTMVMTFFHYTSRANAEAITGHRLGNAHGALPDTENPWQCNEGQPQKWLDFKKQHKQGFYMTTIAPDVLLKNPTKMRKTGINKIDPDMAYVLVFQIEWAYVANFVRGHASRGNVKIEKVGEPEKYCATMIGKTRHQGEDIRVPFENSACVYAGPGSSY
jgi:hypothetical protein